MNSFIVAPLASHFERHRRRINLDFFLFILGEGIVISIVILGLLDLILHLDSQTVLARMGKTKLLVVGLVFAPLVETFFLNVFPIYLLRTRSFWVRVCGATAIFTCAHLPQGIGPGIAAGLLGGFYLSFAYAHWSERSWLEAYWLTSAMHAARNAILIVTIFVVDFLHF
jgi:hypothetical protein